MNRARLSGAWDVAPFLVVTLVAVASAAGALAACRPNQPGNDPRPTPNSPIPDIDRPQEGSSGSVTSTSESSDPKGDHPSSSVPIGRDAGR